MNNSDDVQATNAIFNDCSIFGLFKSACRRGQDHKVLRFLVSTKVKDDGGMYPCGIPVQRGSKFMQTVSVRRTSRVGLTN